MVEDKLKKVKPKNLVESTHSVAESMMTGVFNEAERHVVEMEESSRSLIVKPSIYPAVDLDEVHTMAESMMTGVFDKAEHHVVEEIEQTHLSAENLISNAFSVAKDHLNENDNNNYYYNSNNRNSNSNKLNKTVDKENIIINNNNNKSTIDGKNEVKDKQINKKDDSITTKIIKESKNSKNSDKDHAPATPTGDELAPPPSLPSANQKQQPHSSLTTEESNKSWPHSALGSKAHTETPNEEQQKKFLDRISMEKEDAPWHAMFEDEQKRLITHVDIETNLEAREEQLQTRLDEMKDVLKVVTHDDELKRALKPKKISAPPRAKPFGTPLETAYRWSVMVCIRYLKDVMEMPEYEAAFLHSEVSGPLLICLTDEKIEAMGITHFLHGKKILSHSAHLRSVVLQYVATKRPLKFADWNQFHMASWLHFNDKCPQAAFNVLVSRLDGFDALKMKKEEIAKAVGGVGSDESEIAVRSIEAKKMAAMNDLLEEENTAFKSLEDHVLEEEQTRMPPMVDTSTGINKEEEGDDKKSKSQGKNKKNKKETRTAKKKREQKEKEDEKEQVKKEKEEKEEKEKQKEKEMKELEKENENEKSNSEKNNKTVPIATDDDDIPGVTVPTGGDEAAPVSEIVQPLVVEPQKYTQEVDDKVKEIESMKQIQQQKPLQPELQSQPQPLSLETETPEQHASFLSTIAILEDRVKQQTKMMDGLRSETTRISQERLLDVRKSNEAISQLRAERERATQALSQVSTLYEKDVSNLQQQVSTFTTVLDEVSKEQKRTQEYLFNSTANSATSVSLATTHESLSLSGTGTQSLASPTAHNTATSCNTTLKTSLSPESTGKTIGQKPLTQIQTESTIALKTGENVNINTNIANVTAPAALENFIPSTSIESKVIPASFTVTTHEEIDSRQNTSLPAQPPSMRTNTIAIGEAEGSSSIKADSAVKEARNYIKGVQDVDLKATLDDEAEDEVDLWQSILSQYTYSDDTIIVTSDSRVVLRKVASLWVRLGLKMLEDASGVRSSNADNKDSRDQLLTTKMIDALTGMQRCAYTVLMNEEEKGNDHNNRDNIPKDSAVFRYQQAVIMVFQLGMIRKLFERFKDKRQRVQLLFLFNRLREGELPITELGREDLRWLMENSLNVSFNENWAKFDGVIQRLDPDNKGFVDASKCLQAFKLLNPFTDIVSSRHWQRVPLMLLSCATSQLTDKNKDINNLLSDLVVELSTKVASCRMFVQRNYNNEDDEDYSGPAIVGSFEGLGEGDYGDLDEDKGDTDLSKEMRVVSDMLYELTRRHFDQPPGPIHHRAKALLRDEDEGDMKVKLRKRARTTKVVGSSAEKLMENCSALSNMVQIYEGRGQQLITAFSTLMVTFINFRRACARYRLLELKNLEDKQQEDAHIMRKKDILTRLLARMEVGLAVLLGTGAEESKVNADRLTMFDHESLLCDMMGIVVPTGDLLKQQLDVEVELEGQDQSWKGSSGGAESDFQYVSTLKSIRQRIFGINVKASKTEGPGVIESVNRKMHEQRVIQLSDFLDYLNSRAERRRRLINGLLRLWDAAVIARQTQYTAEEKLTRYDPAVLMQPKDIVRRAAEAERQVLGEMQMKPSSHVIQLSNRYSTLKVALERDSLPDPDGSILLAMQEIGALERCIKQSNVDAIRLCQRIVRKVLTGDS